MSKPSISIVTVVFNSFDLIEETIVNVISQEFKDFEYIIIDGGSTDGTLSIIRKYESHIDFWLSEKDQGIYDAMNKAVKYTKGRYIQFLNAGDKFISNKILSIIFSKLELDKINVFGYLMNGKAYFPKTDFISILKGMPCHQAMFYDRNYLINNPFSLQFKYTADYHNLLNALNKRCVSLIDLIIVEYDLSGISSGKNVYRRIRIERMKSVIESETFPLKKFPMILYNLIRLIA